MDENDIFENTFINIILPKILSQVGNQPRDRDLAKEAEVDINFWNQRRHIIFGDVGEDVGGNIGGEEVLEEERTPVQGEELPKGEPVLKEEPTQEEASPIVVDMGLGEDIF